MKNVVTEMLEQSSIIDGQNYEQWRETIANFDELHPLTYHEDSERIKPQWVIERSWNYGIWFSCCYRRESRST